MILRLLLIFSLSSVGYSFKYEIKEARCMIDTACYIRKSCLVDETNDNELVRYNDKPLKECDVFMQIRPFSIQKLHIMIQVNSSDDPISAEGVALKQEKEQFQCSNGIEDTGNKENLKITPLGDRHPFTPNLLFCSFILELKDKTKSFQTLFMNTLLLPELTYTTGSKSNSIKFATARSAFWDNINSMVTCDPDVIESRTSSNESHVFEKIDNTRSPISCSSLGVLRVRRSDNSFDYPSTITCKNMKWTYERIRQGQPEIVEIDLVGNKQEIIEADCIIKKCSLCKPLENVPCEGCVAANYTNAKDECVTSTCINGLWRISLDNAPIEGEMKCDHNENSQDERDSVWYFIPKGTTDDTDPQQVSKGSCANAAKCSVRIECPFAIEKQSECIGIIRTGSKEDLSCPSTHQLKYKLDKKITNATNLICNMVTGKYIDEGTTVPVPEGSIVFCHNKTIMEIVETEPVAASAAGLSQGSIIGISVGGILLLIGGGVGAWIFVCLRRKRREKESEERWTAMRKYKVNLAKMAAEPNPDVMIDRRGVPDSEKTKWELRTYRAYPDSGKKNINPQMLKEWDDDSFRDKVMKAFFECCTRERMMILHTLTAFDAYNFGEKTSKKKGKPASKNFGNIRQFCNLWFECTRKYFDCYVGWEYMWRFLRILYENFVPHDDHRAICKGIVKMVVDWARPMLNELSYKMRRDELACDTQLRHLAVRMLLWAEAPDVIAQVTVLADQSILDLEVSIRPAVLQFAARQLGRAREMKDKYWPLLIGLDPKNTIPDFSGTMRQHMLFALCSARDESKKNTDDEFKVLKETMTAIFYYEELGLPHLSFSPADQVWALRGAAEFVTNMKPAIELFIELCPRNVDDIYEQFMLWRSNFNKEQREVLRPSWQKDVRNLCNVVAEMCTMKKQFNDVATIASVMATWALTKNEKEFKLSNFALTQLQDRAFNLSNLLADPKVADYFYEGVYHKDRERRAKILHPYSAANQKERRKKAKMREAKKKGESYSEEDENDGQGGKE